MYFGCNHSGLMLRLIYMKDLVLLPLKFLAIMAVLLLLCAGFQVIIHYALASQELRTHFIQFVPGISFSTLFTWFFPCIGIATLLMLSGILHNKRMRPLKLLLLFVFVSAFNFGILVVHAQVPVADRSPKTFDFNIPERTILPFDQGYFYILHDQGSKVSGVLYHSTDFDSQFEVIPDAIKNPKTRHLLIAEKGVVVPAGAIMGVRAAPFTVPVYLEGPINVLVSSSGYIYKTAGADWFLMGILATSFAFALVSLWFFIRMTQWYLLNVMFGLAVLFVVLGLASTFSSPEVTSLFLFVPVQFRIFILPGIYTLCGLFMFGWVLFLPSLKEVKIRGIL